MNKFNRFVYTSFRLFSIRKEERLTVALALLAFSLLNAVTVCRYWDVFSVPSDNYHRLFVRHFHISGFDPLTYQVISEWFPAYNIYRHPLLAFFMWPFSCVNNWLITTTGTNFATILAAVAVILCATYSVVFLFRIFRNVIQLSIRQSNILCLLYFSFSYIMLASMVPDHFVMSQFCLLLTLWISDEYLKKRSLWLDIKIIFTTANYLLNGKKI